MYKIKIILAGVLIVVGLNLAGAETTSDAHQVFAGTCGIIMFALGLRWAAAALRKE